jgi:hypothetical protein
MRGYGMEILVGDVVRLKKQHPCGGYEWKVNRIGTDIGITCSTCDRYVLLPRSVFERRVKSFISRGPIIGSSSADVFEP